MHDSPIVQIYKDANANSFVHEITVEDPSPGFCALRDRLDIQCCCAQRLFSVPPSEVCSSKGMGTSKLTIEDIKHVQSLTKLTTGQVWREVSQCPSKYSPCC